MEDAKQTNFLKGRGKPAVIQDPDEVEQGRAFENSNRGGSSVGLLQGFPERKHQGNASDEDEEREDQVLEMESRPGFVVQLFGDHPQETAAGKLLKPAD